ncbi:alpha/beta hydrolase-fold protein [uncultured Allomuricauda sp.]|uniref:alpha/beta hydrolase-fold protein n=1 Tax=Flagellimonas sp. W118 TaxID=3410791 RepID=UPI002604627B|nr:alpha/beta hydrolase-fold protein [uncultured Allomuricauda sp.]
MKKMLIRFLVPCLFLVLSTPSVGQLFERRTIEEISFSSQVLKEKRPILISKPTLYEERNERYFVVYVLDGNMNTGFTSGIAELLYQSGFPRLLVIGIPSTYRDRDLTPTAYGETTSGGGADNFLRFLKEELIPYVDENYRTHDFKVLIGHSFGGLFATHTLYTEPDLFNAYVAITPTVVYDNFYSGNKLRRFFRNKNTLPTSFFFSVGNEPNPEGDAVFHLNELFKKEAPSDLSWKFEYYRKENHSTTPLIATLDGLRFIFQDLVLEDEIVKIKGLEYLKTYYANLKNKYNIPIKVPQRTLMNYGYYLMENSRNDEALDVFGFYAEIHPTIPVPYDAMADIYIKNNDKKKAIFCLETLLKMNPGYDYAKKRLDKLNGN